MDLALHFRVLSRYRRLVVVGLLAAVFLALLAYVRIGPDGISYRQTEKWQSVARLFATAGGNPFGAVGDDSSRTDPTTSAVLAAEFANSDAVTRILATDGRLEGEVVAAANQVDGEFLPFIDVAGIASKPAAARNLARRAAEAMSQYVSARQAGIKAARRVTLELVNAPDEPTLVEGRSKTMPVMIFLAVMSVVIGLAYIRENLRLSARRPAAMSETGASISALEPPDTAVQTPRHVSVEERGDRLQPRAAPRPGGPTLGTTASQTGRQKT